MEKGGPDNVVEDLMRRMNLKTLKRITGKITVCCWFSFGNFCVQCDVLIEGDKEG